VLLPDPAAKLLRRATDSDRNGDIAERRGDGALPRGAAVARDPRRCGALPEGDPRGTPLLERLSRDVSAKLGSKPALLVWGMKDVAFRPGPNIPRMRATFPDHVLVELPDAKHYIQEDAPDRISKAIIDRFD
jgi:pimeloyl-ACP methyl ester carboxylesterase